MKTKFNAFLTAMDVRISNSRFQQAVYDWQDAHPVVTSVVDITLHVIMWVLCILCCAMLVLSTIALVMWALDGGSVQPMDVILIASMLLGACLSTHQLRNW